MPGKASRSGIFGALSAKGRTGKLVATELDNRSPMGGFPCPSISRYPCSCELSKMRGTRKAAIPVKPIRLTQNKR
jgi:hypothetical protein